MGMSQVITVCESRIKRVRLQEGYELRPTGRLASLQTKLWNWCKSRGIIAPHLVEHEKVIQIVIDEADLFDRIWKQYSGLMETFTNLKAVYMGKREFAELMQRRDLHDYNGGPFSVNSTGSFTSHTGHRHLFNLPVHVLPHMQGILIVDR